MDNKIKEGLGDLAHAAEKDHEVQMARAELYKLAKYAIKLHEKLKGVSEAEGLEGWVQAKITKSADMIGSVYHHLDYQEVDDEPMMDLELPAKEMAVEAKVEMCPEACCGKPITECSCGPDCKHCDCYEKNKVDEGKIKDKILGKKKDAYKESLQSKLNSKTKGLKY
jgi:hypothetical protein